MYEDLAHTSKVHLLQSLVSAILVEMVFNSYYVGLSPEQTEQFRRMEELLLSFSKFPACFCFGGGRRGTDRSQQLAPTNLSINGGPLLWR